MPNTPLDEQLREFLADHDRARRENKTIESVLEKQDAMMIALQRIARDRLEDRVKIQRHDIAIGKLQSQVGLLSDVEPAVPDWRPTKEERASGHDLTAIVKAQAELEERLEEDRKRELDEQTWWRRQRWLWFGIALSTLSGLFLSGCAGYALYRIQTIEKAIASPSR